MVSVVATADHDDLIDLVAPIFEPGTILNRVYEVQRVLGRGNVGVVYLCRHLALDDRLMAVKVLDSEVALDQVARRRFVNEFRATSDVAHRNIIRTFEYFEDDGVCGLAMEYVAGGDLFDLIEKSQPMSFDLIRNLLKQVCSGLAVIHANGIVHRDIKPENILLTRDLQAKIADFGIASLGARERATVAGNLVGALDYLSPEYIQYGEFDQRSDLYAVGALAFKMITGRTPFEGLTLRDTLTRRVSVEADNVAQYRADCPVELANLVAKALARNPEARYQTADEIIDQLERIGQAAPLVLGQIRPRVAAPRRYYLQFSKPRLMPQSRLRCFGACASWLLLLLALSSGLLDPSPTVLAAPRSENALHDVLQVSKNFVHTVHHRGESLSIVARWYTGSIDNWTKLAQANPGLDPNLISVGQKLNIPKGMLVRSEPLPPEYVEKFQFKGVKSENSTKY